MPVNETETRRRGVERSAPAAIGRQIADLQSVLLTLAKDRTDQIYLASFPTALPDTRKGIRIKAR